MVAAPQAAQAYRVGYGGPVFRPLDTGDKERRGAEFRQPQRWPGEGTQRDTFRDYGRAPLLQEGETRFRGTRPVPAPPVPRDYRSRPDQRYGQTGPGPRYRPDDGSLMPGSGNSGRFRPLTRPTTHDSGAPPPYAPAPEFYAPPREFTPGMPVVPPAPAW